MILLFRILFTAIFLFFFITVFLENFQDRDNAIVYKLYIFTFVFILQIILNIFNNIFNKDKITLNSIMDTAVNNALLAVIAFDIYGDLTYQKIINLNNKHQSVFALVLLIVGLITTVKLLQLLLTQ
jgi:hypothetical protein